MIKVEYLASVIVLLSLVGTVAVSASEESDLAGGMLYSYNPYFVVIFTDDMQIDRGEFKLPTGDVISLVDTKVGSYLDDGFVLAPPVPYTSIIGMPFGDDQYTITLNYRASEKRGIFTSESIEFRADFIPAEKPLVSEPVEIIKAAPPRNVTISPYVAASAVDGPLRIYLYTMDENIYGKYLNGTTIEASITDSLGDIVYEYEGETWGNGYWEPRWIIPNADNYTLVVKASKHYDDYISSDMWIKEFRAN